MKKKVFWLAAMAVTVSMASCSLEEVVEQPAPQAIGFSSFVGKPTKAVTETSLTALQTSGFKVWGGYDGNDAIFVGRDVTYSDSQWGYTGTEYWVPSKDYKFAALGPIAAVAAGTPGYTYAGGLVLSNYSVTDLATSKDLVYASAERLNATSAPDYTNAVSFTFGHIMSWIKIKFVHKMTSGYKITVSDVNVENVKTNATYTASTPAWSAPNTAATFTGQTPHSYKTSGNTDDSTSPLNENGDYGIVDFIAIPQTIATGTPFKVTFKLSVTDNKETSLVTDKSVTATMNSEQTWKSNYVYVYTAELDDTVLGLHPIKFTVDSVTPWDDDDDDDNKGGNLDY